MKKLFPSKHIVLQCGVFVAPIIISLSTESLVTRYATYQLKPQTQSKYPYKEFSFVHRRRSFLLNLNIITTCVEFKVKQDLDDLDALDVLFVIGGGEED